MFCIGYLSSGTAEFGLNELSLLISVARKHNADRAVTGMLCFHDGNFLQFLEGDESAVEETFRIIGRDRRHSGIIELFNGAIQERLFPDWTMALVAFDQLSAEQQNACKNLRDVRVGGADAPHHQFLVDAFLNAFRLSIGGCTVRRPQPSHDWLL